MFEGILLSEICQQQKDKYFMIPRNIWNTRIVNLERQKVEWWLPAAGTGGRMRSYNLMNMEFHFRQMKKFLKMDDSDGCITMWMY